MAYSTLDDVKKLIPEDTLVQLTDDEDLGVINRTRVDEAIAQADAEIDSYCGTRYKAPFSSAPDIVKKISVDIAVYNLYSRRVEEIPATRTERYRNAIRQLEGISKGIISLGEDPAPSAASQTAHTVDMEGPERTFTRDKTRDM